MEYSEKHSPLDENFALTTETYEDLEEAISQLDQDAQKILFMYYVEGYRIEEIAQKEGITKDSIKQRLYRIRRKIKEMLLDV